MFKFVTISISILAVFVAYYLLQSDNFDPGSIKDKRVLVTGASSGIGEELAYKYARLGAKLVLTARRAELLDKVAEKCRQLGANVVKAVPADMFIPADRENLATKALETLKGLDILILNHGNAFYKWSEASAEDVALVHEAMDLGFLSYVHLTSLLRKSLEQSQGYIGVTSSVMGKFAIAGLTHYSAMKHALQGYYSTLRQEFRLRNTSVSVTLAVFSSIDTESVRTMYRKAFPNSEVESIVVDVEEAVDAYVRAISARAHELVHPTRIQIWLIINGIIPVWFENVANSYVERLRNH